MFEKVNPSHPDKVADRIAGALVDREIDGKPYSQIVDIARNFIEKIGGFEKFAEWGLLR